MPRSKSTTRQPGRLDSARAKSSAPVTANSELLVPALKAHMGDWAYYIAFMRFGDLAARVRTAGEIHKSERLKELIQRQLRGKRASELKEYLLSQPQRFFTTLVIGVYGGDPQWFELAPRSSSSIEAEDLPDYMAGAVGFLRLSGGERLFALDGQHRLVGIKEAVQDPEAGDLADEEVSVIFVAHQSTASGMERTRRLFTTLNRYAKPVSKPEIVALDEDDVVAVVTRRLVDDYPLFTGKKSSTTKTASLPANDSVSFVPMVTIYDALTEYLRPESGNWASFKKRRPREEVIDRYYEGAVELWDAFRRHFPSVAALARASDDDEYPGKHRKPGGLLFFRPVGVMLYVRAARALVDGGATLDAAVRRLAELPSRFRDEPWSGLLYDPVNERMETWPNQQRVALGLMVYGAGGSLESVSLTEARLRKSWAGLIGVEDPASLPLRRYARPLSRARQRGR